MVGVAVPALANPAVRGDDAAGVSLPLGATCLLLRATSAAVVGAAYLPLVRIFLSQSNSGEAREIARLASSFSFAGGAISRCAGGAAAAVTVYDPKRCRGLGGNGFIFHVPEVFVLLHGFHDSLTSGHALVDQLCHLVACTLVTVTYPPEFGVLRDRDLEGFMEGDVVVLQGNTEGEENDVRAGKSLLSTLCPPPYA